MAELEKEIRRIVQEEVNNLRKAVWKAMEGWTKYLDGVHSRIDNHIKCPTAHSGPTIIAPSPPTKYSANDFTKRLAECHRKRPTIITDTFISEDTGLLPERHMQLWTEQERADAEKELVKFLKKQARRHKRTPSAMAFSIVRALKLSGVEL